MTARLLPLACAVGSLLLTGCGQSISSHDVFVVYATWRCFERDSFLVTITTSEIQVMENGKVIRKKGHWSNHRYTLDTPDGIVTAATESPDESLEVRMAYLEPNDADVVVCTKIMRSDIDDQRYPPASAYGTITYPPPKGAIKVGMLEADMERLPWKCKIGQIVGENNVVGPVIYDYHSDDPRLPDLLVTVYKGRVTDVNGGAEDTDGPDYEVKKQPATSSWVDRLFFQLFGK